MKNSFKKTIKRQFFVTGLFSALFIAAVFITLFSINTYETNMDHAKQKLISANVHLLTYTEGVLEGLAMSTNINASLQSVVDYTPGDETKKRDILSLFEATTKANPNIKFCFAGYENGDLLINDYIAPEGFDSRTRPWYIAAVEKFPEISLGKPYQDIKTKEWLVSVSRAFVDEKGQLKGVMAVDCTLDYVEELMQDVKYYKSQANFIIEDNGTVFVHPDPKVLHKNANDIVPEITDQLKEPSGYITYNLEGIQRMAYYHKLDEAEWIIVSAIDASEVTRPLFMNIFVTIAGLFVLAIGLGMIQVKLYEKSFVRPLTTLRARIEGITTGKTVERAGDDVYTNEELADIAKRIESMAETSLRKKADELQLILNTTSDGMLVLDAKGNVIHSNERFKEMWGISTFKNISEVSSVILKSEISSFASTLDNSFKRIHLPSGVILEQFSCPLIAEGVPSGRLWSYRNVTEQVKAEENLKQLATTDVLTGVWNRRKFMTQGALEIEMTKRTGLPLSLIFLDVDYFKQVNDTYGHSVGDEALKFLTQSIKKIIRSTDLIARLGGEEFCVLAPNTDEMAAGVLAEKLRAFFEANTLTACDKTLSFTISLGVSSYVHGVGGIDELLSSADKACYKAKALGRNRVVIS